MDPEQHIVNRIAQSALITFDLNDYYLRDERVMIDLKENLFMGQILREKDFREWVDSVNWQEFSGKLVRVTCTADAIIPAWAYMLLDSRLQPFALEVVIGNPEEFETRLFIKSLDKVDFSQFNGKKIVIKGCGDVEVPPAVYAEVTHRLMPYADKMMYGEPCSSVPVYRRSKVKL